MFPPFTVWAFVWSPLAVALIVLATVLPEVTTESTAAPTQTIVESVEPKPEVAPSEQSVVAVKPEAELAQQESFAAQPVQTQYGPDNSKVDLMPVEITDGMMTVTLRYRSQPDHSLRTRYPIEEVSYVDDATSKRFSVAKDKANSWLASPKNSSGDRVTITIHDDEAIAWFKFPAPPPEAQTISINIPEVSPFNRVDVER